jgi:ketosteroid isomerase-like protein
MSQENVDLILGAIETGQQDPEAFFSIFDPEVEWDVSGLGYPDATTYHGLQGVREFYRRWIGAFDDFGYEVEEVIDAGDSVIVALHQWGRGKGSGVMVEDRLWVVWTVRRGKVVRYGRFSERGPALEAAGLSE